MNLYKFENDSMESDELHPKTGKVVKYKTIYLNAPTEDVAIAELMDEYSYVDDNWKLKGCQKLGPG